MIAMLGGARVWVGEGMDVAHGAIHCRRNLEQVNERRRLEVAWAAGLDLGVAGVLQEHRYPADLKIGAGGHNQICRTCPSHETGFRVDAMDVLKRARGRVHVELVATQLP